MNRPAPARPLPAGPVRIGLVLINLVLVGLAALGLAAAAGIVGPGSAPAGAHTELLQGSPGPNQRVGGTVDFVDLVFLAPITEMSVDLVGPDGVVLDGELAATEGQIIRFSMDPLSRPGRYAVRYSMVSHDGDLTSSGYFFEFDPDAIPPARLGVSDVADPPTDWSWRVAQVGGGVLLLVVVGLLTRRYLANRRALHAARAAQAGVNPRQR